jgi:hypothetical protein
MMRSTILAAMVLALLTGPGRGQDATKVPSGPAPSIFAVAEVDRTAGTYTVNQAVTVQVPVSTEKTIIVGGMEKKVAVTSLKTEYRTEIRRHTLKGLEFYNVKGEKLKDDEAMKRFVPGAVVLLSADGKKVDPAYLRIVKDDALIVVLPSPTIEK